MTYLAMPNAELRRTSGTASLIAIWLLGAMSLVQALSARLLPLERHLYAVVFLMIAGLALFGRWRVDRLQCFLTVVGLLSLFAIPIAFQPHKYPTWIISDSVVLLAPAVFWIVIEAHPQLLNEKKLRIYMAILFVAAVASMRFSSASGDYDRFEPPKFLLFSACWLYFFSARNPVQFIAFGSLLFGLLAISWLSSVRAAVVIWFAIGGLVAIRYAQPKPIYLLAAPVLLIPILAGRHVVENSPDQLGRFGRIDWSSLTESGFVQVRYWEAYEALEHYFDTPNPVQLVFGYGLGGSYPVRGYSFQRMPPRLQQVHLNKKATSEGFAHVIHYGPARMLFRYGLMGIGIYVILSIVVLTDVLQFLMRRGPPAFVYHCFLLAMFCYWARFHIKPVETEMDFAFVLAGYLTLRESRGRTGGTDRVAKKLGRGPWLRSSASATRVVTTSDLSDSNGTAP